MASHPFPAFLRNRKPAQRALVGEIEKGDAYVNVHTEQHPDGELRGQIAKP